MRFFKSCTGIRAVPIADRAAAVLVTRSEPGASVLVDALRQAGYAALRFPVLEIRPLDAPRARRVVAELATFDTAIFVSGHAVRLGVDVIDAVWPQRPRLVWIAVGRTTANALDERGIDALTPELETSEGILALPQLREMVGRRVLVCAGRGGRALLAGALEGRGAQVERLELYAREPLAVDVAARALPVGRAVAAVVISSADGGRAFVSVWRGIGGDPNVVLIAPSLRVAQTLMELGFQRVVVADGPGASAVVAVLNRNADKES